MLPQPNDVPVPVLAHLQPSVDLIGEDDRVEELAGKARFGENFFQKAAGDGVDRLLWNDFDGRFDVDMLDTRSGQSSETIASFAGSANETIAQEGAEQLATLEGSAIRQQIRETVERE